MRWLGVRCGDQVSTSGADETRRNKGRHHISSIRPEQEEEGITPISGEHDSAYLSLLIPDTDQTPCM